MHLASLYHDDVMDEATMRRNVESVNARFGNLVAIVAGDFLLARSAEIAAGLGTEIAALLAATLGELCQGQVAEVRAAFRVDRSRDEYSTAIAGKTASLMATSCRIGALTGGLARAEVDAFTEFGRCFGMIFQVRDDILDVVGTEAELGKPAGQDLAEGIYTLPVLLALADPVHGPELRDLLGQPLGLPEQEKARAIVAGSGAIAESVRVARAYADGAAAAAHAGPSPRLADALAPAGPHHGRRAPRSLTPTPSAPPTSRSSGPTSGPAGTQRAPRCVTGPSTADRTPPPGGRGALARRGRAACVQQVSVTGWRESSRPWYCPTPCFAGRRGPPASGRRWRRGADTTDPQYLASSVFPFFWALASSATNLAVCASNRAWSAGGERLVALQPLTGPAWRPADVRWSRAVARPLPLVARSLALRAVRTGRPTPGPASRHGRTTPRRTRRRWRTRPRPGSRRRRRTRRSWPPEPSSSACRCAPRSVTDAVGAAHVSPSIGSHDPGG